MSGGRGSGSRKGIPNKLSMNAILDMDRLGINPIEALWECYQEAMKSFIISQGCMMLETLDGKPFPLRVWENDDDERESEIKVSINSPSIWWWKKK